MLSHPIPVSISTGKWRGYISFLPIHQKVQLLLKGALDNPISVEQTLALDESLYSFANGEEEMIYYATNGRFSNCFGVWSDLPPEKRTAAVAILCIIFPAISHGRWGYFWSFLKQNQNLKLLYQPIVEGLYKYVIQRKLELTLLDLEKHMEMYDLFILHAIRLLSSCSSWKEMISFLVPVSEILALDKNTLEKGPLSFISPTFFQNSNSTLDEKYDAHKLDNGRGSTIRRKSFNEIVDERMVQRINLQFEFVQKCAAKKIPFQPNFNNLVLMYSLKNVIPMAVISVIDLGDYELAVQIAMQSPISFTAIASEIIDKAGPKLSTLLQDMGKMKDLRTYEILVGQIIGQVVVRAQIPDEVPKFILNCTRGKKFKLHLLIQFGFLNEALKISKKWEAVEFYPIILRQAIAMDDRQVAAECQKLVKKMPT